MTINISDVDSGDTVLVTLPVFITFITIPVILIGNCLTIVCVWRTPELKTLTNMYVVSLAVADFMTGCVIPLNLSVLIEISIELHFNKPFCLVLISLNMITVGVSMTTMTLIAFDRYLYIVRPLKYETMMTLSRTKLFITLSWVVSVSLNALPIYFNNWDHAPGCVFFQTIPAEFIMYYVCIYFWTGSAISAMLYGAIFRVAWRQQKAVMALYGRHAYNSLTKANWQRLKLFFAVFGTHFLCWLPVTITFTVSRFMAIPSSVAYYTIPFIYVNSSANCFIYAFMNRDFKKALKTFFSDVKRHLCSNSVAGSSATNRVVTFSTRAKH